MILYIIHIPLIGLLAYLIGQQQKANFSSATFYATFLLKLLCGIGIGVLYYYFYQGGDTISFHEASLKLSALGKEDIKLYFKIFNADPEELYTLLPEVSYTDQPRAFFMVKVLSLLNFFTNGNYWLNSLYLSTFSFWGMWRLANTLGDIYPATKSGAVIAFLLYPSTTFWSAGILKESLLMGSIGVLCSTFLEICLKQKLHAPILKVMYSIVAAWLILKLKFYYAAILFPLLLTAGIALYVKKQMYPGKISRKIGVIAIITILAVGFYAATYFHSALSLNALPEEIVNLYQLSQSNNHGSAAFSSLVPSYTSLLRHLPIAVVTGLFRPLPFETGNTLQLLASLENALLLGATIIGLILLVVKVWTGGWKLKMLSTLTKEKVILCTATTLFVVFMAWLLTLAYPNFGSQARYRVGYLPFYVYLLYCMLRHSFSFHHPKTHEGNQLSQLPSL